MTREHDIVLFGATGFTGRLVAEYLAQHTTLRWAIAGRSREKLRVCAAEIGKDVPIIVADRGDPVGLRAMAESAKVVATTVGPYGATGAPLVEACVEAGTAYADLTGEVFFVRAMIDRFHERAQKTGARIVHCCGFDSIPSDLGALMLADHLVSRHGVKLESAHLRVAVMKGGVSGGTVASAFDILDAGADPEIARIIRDPYALVPTGTLDRQDRNESRLPSREDGKWVGPFVMAMINTRIVRRSAALLPDYYSTSFRYDEATAIGRGLQGLAFALGYSATIGALSSTARIPGLRQLYRRLLPKAGEGPSSRRRDEGFFRVKLLGESSGGLRVQGSVSGPGDPGYKESARMFAESAVHLATVPGLGGVLTPAVAMGMPLVERLRASGMTFDVADRS